jgi:hypothetical protein
LHEILIKGHFYQRHKKFILCNDGKHNYTIILTRKYADFLFLVGLVIAVNSREWIHLLFFLPVTFCLSIPSFFVLGKVVENSKLFIEKAKC